MIEEYLTSKEIADKLSLKRFVVTARIARLGIKPAYIFGGTHLYHKNALELISHGGQRGGDRRSKEYLQSKKSTVPTPLSPSIPSVV
jgi:hypothetical protein